MITDCIQTDVATVRKIPTKESKIMNRIMNSTLKSLTVRGLLVVACILSLAMQPFTASAAVAAAPTTLTVLWTAGGLSAGTDSAGQAARIAADASGNVAVVSGPAGGRLLAVTSYTSSGVLRWQRTVSPSSGTFVGDWVVAAPNGDFVVIGHNQDSHGRPVASTMLRYASDGTLLWQVDFSSGFFPSTARLLVDAAGNAYLAWSAVGSGFLVQKYNPAGALLWSQVDSTGSGYAIASSLALSPDGADVAVTGSISGGATWITAVYNTTTGSRRWQVAAAEGIAALDVIVDATRVYVTGQGSVGINGFLTVVAYDRVTGTRLWRTDANPATCCAIGLRIALAPDGSLVVAGRTATGGYFDWWIVAMNTNGTVRWQALRDAAVTGDELPAAVFVLADGTTVVSGTGGPVTRDILGNSYMQGVTAGYSSNGTLLWEGFSKLPTVWATALPNGNVCATGGYDALITCFRVPGGFTSLEPTAVMSATPSTGMAPLTVAFDGSGSFSNTGTALSSWTWSFGDGGSGSGVQTTHVYSTPGTYTAILTVTDSLGASGFTTKSIVVNAAPPTPVPTNTPPASTSTGFLSPSANAPQTSSAGDNNGYQTSPANAYANDASVATDTNSGTNTNTSCTNSGKDKHHYYNYNLNIPASAVIQGIQVRLDARADATGGSPKICVQLSWDGGTTWTTAKSTTTLGTTETTYTLGSTTDLWGRTWTSGNFSNTNFRIRIIDVASNASRDFFLDYIAVNVTYQP
jgi:PKD repeat protein